MEGLGRISIDFYQKKTKIKNHQEPSSQIYKNQKIPYGKNPYGKKKKYYPKGPQIPYGKNHPKTPKYHTAKISKILPRKGPLEDALFFTFYSSKRESRERERESERERERKERERERGRERKEGEREGLFSSSLLVACPLHSSRLVRVRYTALGEVVRCGGRGELNLAPIKEF